MKSEVLMILEGYNLDTVCITPSKFRDASPFSSPQEVGSFVILLKSMKGVTFSNNPCKHHQIDALGTTGDHATAEHTELTR